MISLCNFVTCYFNCLTNIEQGKECDVQILKLPKKMRKRGRPKGSGLTVVGLPKKKVCLNKPTPFVKKSEWDKSKGI